MDAHRTPLHGLFEGWGAAYGERDGIVLPRRFPPAEEGDVADACRAARDDAALAEGGDRAWIEVAGPDAPDFLQRLVSSDVRRLNEGSGQWSALLDGKGRWIADLLLFRLPPADGEDADLPPPRFGLDLPACREEAVLGELDRMHFGEDLVFRAREDAARLLVLGPEGDARCADASLPVPATGDPFAHAGDGRLRALRRPDRGVPCLDLLGEREAVRAAAEHLYAAGVSPIGDEALETLRIADGRPRWGRDFDGEHTLPDANEWQRASLSKGCYAGQEVVAKVHTYGRAPWQSCGLRFGAARTPLEGAELRDASGAAVGRVTSWAWSPLEDAAVGLGMIRRKAAEEGARLRAHARAGEDPDGVSATVTLPQREPVR